jgi:drug/metabolite transporter (DMT)-like permease
LLLGGNGLVMLAERSVPSGLAALIIAVVPLWIVLLRVTNAERVRRGTLLGVLIGFVGVTLLVASRGLTGEVDVIGMLMVIGSSASWAVGSFYSRRLPLPADPFVSTVAQMICGGIALGAVGVAAGELARLRPEQFATESSIALGYLAVFGSILAFSAYTWLLQNAPVSKVATYAYVNPVVAIFLGWLVLAEAITPSMAIGGAMIVVGVALVIRSESRRAQMTVLAGAGSTATGRRAAR